MREYYDRRAPEYDLTTYLAGGKRRGFRRDLAQLEELVASLESERTLDVGCGTGWLTRYLAGSVVVALDQSESMLSIARKRAPHAVFVRGDLLELPFARGSFDLVFASHVYGHLSPDAASVFLESLRPIGRSIVLVEQAPLDGHASDEWQLRELRDGSTHRVYKRYFSATELADEIGGEPLLDSRAFVAARARP